MTGRSAFGHVRQRTTRAGRPGRWQAMYEDQSGRQHSKTFATKREASAWLSKQTTQRAEGTWIDPAHGRKCFGEFADEWRDTIVDLRRSSIDRDLGYLDRYIMPTFKDVQLDRIDHMGIRAWQAALSARLAPATVLKARQIFGKILATAVEAGRLAANPCKGVKLPLIDDQEMMFLEPDEVWTLADCIDPRFRAVVLLGAYGGLRAGELFGLAIRNVNPLRRQVSILEQVVESSGALYVGPPKTRAGVRTVPLPAVVADELAPLLARHHDDLLFTAPRGGYIRRSTWRPRFWLPAVERAGLEGLRLHDLRHTAVSLWMAAGVDVKEIARRAGHRSTSTILDRYGHLQQSAADESMARLEALAVRSDTSIVRSARPTV